MAACVMIFSVLVFYQIPLMCSSDKNDLFAVLSALDKLVLYYKENYKSLNLDGFFGLRVLEGQLQVLILEHQTSRYKNLSSDVLNHIIKLKQTAESISAIALKYVESDDVKYYKDFSSVIASPWMTQHPPKKLKPNLRWEIPQYKLKVKVKLTEDLSDKCMTELMKSDCVISESCAEIMTSRGLTGYSITHQLLWTILGEKMPICNLTMNKVIQEQGLGNVSKMRLEMCTNNFYEMVAVVQVLMHGKVHESHQDLFLEQQFVCPSLGFYEFLKKDYLDQIISWQFPSGCFGEIEQQSEDQGKFEIGSILEGYHEGQKLFLPKGDSDDFVGNMQIKNDAEKIISDSAIHVKKSTMSSHADSNGKISKSHLTRLLLPQAKSNALINNSLIFSPQHHNLKQDRVNQPEMQIKHGRRLLVEKEMGSGCLSHKTGVAAGALVMYLRYLLVPSDIKWTGQHDLFLSDTRNLLQADNEGQVKLSDEGEDDNDEEEEAAADNIGNYNGDEEGDEEEAEEEVDDYNQNEHDYKSNTATNGKSNNNGIQFGQLRNNAIINNEDNERDQEDYVNGQKKASSKQYPAPHGQAMTNVDDAQDQQEDHNYYDDEGETEKGIIKKSKQLTPRPHPPIKIRKKHRENSRTPILLYNHVQEEFSSDQPNYPVILLVSVSPFFILFFFLLKFIRKRRIHIRYHF